MRGRLCGRDHGQRTARAAGSQAALPLARAENGAGREAASVFSGNKARKDVQTACDEILAGNPLLLIDGIAEGTTLGTKKVSLRAIMEPQTSITVKGPREGFIEDVKTNMGLIRRRLKTPALRFETMEVGRASKTAVVVAYLEGIAQKEVVREIKDRIGAIDIDGVPDSSYIGKFLAKKSYSLFKQAGTTEKPDILCAKMLEGGWPCSPTGRPSR